MSRNPNESSLTASGSIKSFIKVSNCDSTLLLTVGSIGSRLFNGPRYKTADSTGWEREKCDTASRSSLLTTKHFGLFPFWRRSTLFRCSGFCDGEAKFDLTAVQLHRGDSSECGTWNSSSYERMKVRKPAGFTHVRRAPGCCYRKSYEGE